MRAKNASFAIPAWGDTAKLEAGELLIQVAASSSGRRISLTAASVVAGEWTTDQGGRILRYIETDSRLFPGFSGSLLLSAEGHALALNTAGLRRRTPLAIPVETLRHVVEKLLKHGDVRRGFLGITTYPIRLPDTVKSQSTGLLVLSVQAGHKRHAHVTALRADAGVVHDVKERGARGRRLSGLPADG